MREKSISGIGAKQTEVWICSQCKKVFNTRWLLARHLKQVHELSSKDANTEAVLSEWWRVYNPMLSKVPKKEQNPLQD